MIKIKNIMGMLISIVLISFFVGCIENDKPNPITLEELYGSWSYTDEQYKTMTWIFFENDSVFTDFFAQGGTSIQVWYSYELDGQDLCFTDLNTSQVFCYDYDYIEINNKLKIIQGDDVAVFIRN
jgi:hypothetical protein